MTVGTLSGCSGFLNDVSSFGGPSVEEVKNNSRQIDYEEMYRNISDYEGEFVYYPEIRLMDVVEGEGTKEYLFALPGGQIGDPKTLYGLWDGDPFQEDDNVEMWGVVNGLKTYTSLTGEKTVIEVDIVDMRLI